MEATFTSQTAMWQVEKAGFLLYIAEGLQLRRHVVAGLENNTCYNKAESSFLCYFKIIYKQYGSFLPFILGSLWCNCNSIKQIPALVYNHYTSVRTTYPISLVSSDVGYGLYLTN
jgi:hypothetical protein